MGNGGIDIEGVCGKSQTRLQQHHEAISYPASEWGRRCREGIARDAEAFFERSVPEPEALEAGLQIVLTNDLRRKLRNIVQPALLIHGENDVIAYPEAAVWMKQQFQDSELVMLPNCSHVPFLSYPDKFVANIVRFTDEFK